MEKEKRDYCELSSKCSNIVLILGIKDFWINYMLVLILYDTLPENFAAIECFQVGVISELILAVLNTNVSPSSTPKFSTSLTAPSFTYSKSPPLFL